MIGSEFSWIPPFFFRGGGREGQSLRSDTESENLIQMGWKSSSKLLIFPKKKKKKFSLFVQKNNDDVSSNHSETQDGEKRRWDVDDI